MTNRKSLIQALIKKFSKKQKPTSTLSSPPADLALLPPPAVWSRALIWTLGAGSMGLLIWSVVTKVEETIILAGEITTKKPGVKVSALDPGVVTVVEVTPHQKVSAGQILIAYRDDETSDRLDSQLRRQRLLKQQQDQEQIIFSLRRQQIEEKISLDRNLLQRLEKLMSVGAIQETQILEKRAEVNKGVLSLSSLIVERTSAKAKAEQQMEDIDQSIRELESKKNRFVVKSPIDGFVQEIRYQSAGEQIQPSDLISIIVPDQSLTAQVRVPSKLSSPLKVDTPATVDIDAFPASEYGSVRARVASISPTTSQSSNQSSEKSYSAALEIIGPQSPDKLDIKSLRPGMAVTAKVRLREKPVIATVFNFLADLFDPLTQSR